MSSSLASLEPNTVNNIEYASLLSKSNQTSDTHLVKPTIFDIIAQENMQSLFKLAYDHIFKWLAQYFTKLNRAKQYSNEIYLLLHSSIEFAYLKAYNSLFSEYFYGMKRHDLNSNSKRLLSILFSIVIPYLKTKLDEFYEDLEKSVSEPELNNDIANLNQRNTTKFKYFFNLAKLIIKKFYLKFYPYLHFVYTSTLWLYKFKFMLNMSDFNSPLQSILNLKLVYNLDADQEEKKLSLVQKMLSVSNRGFTSFLFLIQFLKWYEQYNENESYSSKSKSLVRDFLSNLNKGSENVDYEDTDGEIIAAPCIPKQISENKAYQNSAKNSTCPLCNKKRTNDCVLSVSGLVFCYPCIFKFIKEHKRCPITNYPCTTKDIVRLYVSK